MIHGPVIDRSCRRRGALDHGLVVATGCVVDGGLDVVVVTLVDGVSAPSSVERWT